MAREPVTLRSLDMRLTAVENIAGDITKIKKLVQVWAPVGVTVMITSGLADGRLGAFLRALLTATS